MCDDDVCRLLVAAGHHRPRRLVMTHVQAGVVPPIVPQTQRIVMRAGPRIFVVSHAPTIAARYFLLRVGAIWARQNNLARARRCSRPAPTRISIAVVRRPLAMEGGHIRIPADLRGQHPSLRVTQDAVSRATPRWGTLARADSASHDRQSSIRGCRVFGYDT